MTKIRWSAIIAAVLAVSLCGCSFGGQKKNDKMTGEPDHYTYRYTAEAVEQWDPLGVVDEGEREILSYTTSPLYELQTDGASGETKIVGCLAEALPEDVTAEFAGEKRYGILSEETKGYAWKIRLRDDAVWQDGQKITAQDYVDTIRLMIDSNRKSRQFVSGALALANAAEYIENNYIPVYGEDKEMAQISKKKLFFSMDRQLPALGNVSFGEYYRYYCVDRPQYFRDSAGKDFFPQLESGAEEGLVEVNDEISAMLMQFCKNKGWKDDTWQRLCLYRKDNWDFPWEEVGVSGKGKELTIILAHQEDQESVALALRRLILVPKSLYDQESYATSSSTYLSYGPYQITSFKDGKQMSLVKNESWFGYGDSAYKNDYRTTDIRIYFDKSAQVAQTLFTEGYLDRVELAADSTLPDAAIGEEKAAGSSYYLMEGDFYNLSKREKTGENHQILGYKDFRHAIALLMNRDTYARQFSGAQKVLLGLFGSTYLTGYPKGDSYRETSYGQKALAAAYEVKKAEDLSGFSGQDVEKASQLLQSAYNICLQDGRISDTDQVVLVLSVEDTKSSADQECTYLQQAFHTAAAGTDLENRITVRLAQKDESADIRKIGWQGDPLDPFISIEEFCSEENSFPGGLYPEISKEKITVDGKKVSHSLQEWQQSILDGTYTSQKVRLAILGKLEEAVLKSYLVVSLYEDTDRCAYSLRISAQKERDTVDLRKLTYTMDDAAWAEYCNSNEN